MLLLRAIGRTQDLPLPISLIGAFQEFVTFLQTNATIKRSPPLSSSYHVVIPQELKEYRRAGIRTFADAEVYEADKKRKSTVQPSLAHAAPGSLPKSWQYSGPANTESMFQVGSAKFVLL